RVHARVRVRRGHLPHRVAPGGTIEDPEGAARFVRHRGARGRYLDGDVHLGGGAGDRHARYVQAQGGKDDHGYRPARTQAAGGGVMAEQEILDLREEAERLAAAAFAAASYALREVGADGLLGRAVDAVRNPSPRLVLKVASGASEVAGGIAALLRALQA